MSCAGEPVLPLEASKGKWGVVDGWHGCQDGRAVLFSEVFGQRLCWLVSELSVKAETARGRRHEMRGAKWARDQA